MPTPFSPPGSLYHPVSVGSLTLPGNLFLAPVAGFSDAAFREVCLTRGANLAFTEMVSCEGLARDNKKTEDLLKPAAGEVFPAIQLFCADPDRAAEAVTRVLPYSPAIVDLNCGCPVPKVVKTGAGSALMKTPRLLGRIVAALRAALTDLGHPEVVVSVKLRSGWTADSITYLEAAGAAVEAGAEMVALHPRTRSQGYSGTSDWEHIRILKAEVPVPVIGSGDLFSPGAAEAMLKNTGCDGVMFARGAVGNPFIFHATRILLETGSEPPPPEPEELVDTVMEHLRLTAALKGESVACREMRKHVSAYTRGLRGGAAVRRRVSTATTMDEYYEILNEISR